MSRKVLVVGGGSGGHVTPVVAVVREIIEMSPNTKIEFWTDKKYYKNVVKITTEIGLKWSDENAGNTRTIRVRKLTAGKFRRYRGLKLENYLAEGAKTLRDVTFGNVGGFFCYLAGLIQSLVRLLPKSRRPDVIFLKGGYVGLPVGQIAKLLKIPYVIHESDAVTGLTNKMLSSRAKVIATGLPMDTEDEKYRWVGIPVAPEFKKVSSTRQKEYKKELGFDPEKPLVMVTGGSQGSLHLNQTIEKILPELLKFTSVGLVAGRKYYDDVLALKKFEEWDKAKLSSNFRLWKFSAKMDELLGAADVVVSRAGATTIAELATLHKAVILVPYEKLPGGHQVKNAEKLAEKKAVINLVDDEMMEKPEKLLDAIKTLTRRPKEREILAENLSAETKTDAAKKLAEILLETINETR